MRYRMLSSRVYYMAGRRHADVCASTYFLIDAGSCVMLFTGSLYEDFRLFITKKYLSAQTRFSQTERSCLIFMDQTHEKYEKLKDYLQDLDSVTVAFSGAVDSTFLLKTTVDVLGEQVLAVTASSCSFPKRELEEAKAFCAEHGIRHMVVESEELDIKGFRSNPRNRCYLCKHELFEKILAIAKENGIAAVAEGSNLDDTGDYRPGLIAVKDLGITSPLRYAGLNKNEIRLLSKELGLPTWNKQSFACLSSRFVYGETISEQRLGMVDQAEQLLLDLGGYRTGSMNETLKKEQV